jgi:hypothetical protein
MRTLTRSLISIGIAGLLGMSAAGALAQSSHGGPLSGTWNGYISGGQGAKQVRMTITINARETAGSWKLSAACQGRLTLDSISYGYHHFLRRRVHGTRCTGVDRGAVGDIDCLKRAGARMQDAVTPTGGSWESGGTLRRIRAG